MGADPQPGLQAKVAGSFFSLYSTVLRLSVASTKLLFWTMPATRRPSVLLFLFYIYSLSFGCCQVLVTARGIFVLSYGLSRCDVQAQQLWCESSVAPRHVGS